MAIFNEENDYIKNIETLNAKNLICENDKKGSIMNVIDLNNKSNDFYIIENKESKAINILDIKFEDNNETMDQGLINIVSLLATNIRAQKVSEKTLKLVKDIIEELHNKNKLIDGYKVETIEDLVFLVKNDKLNLKSKYGEKTIKSFIFNMSESMKFFPVFFKKTHQKFEIENIKNISISTDLLDEKNKLVKQRFMSIGYMLSRYILFKK